MLRTRRNHGLEHATIHILSSRHPRTSMAGRSDSHGFYLYGDLTSEEISTAAVEALNRLRQGDRYLAIHPNCGTNLITAGMLAGSAAFLSLVGIGQSDWRERLNRLPLAIIGTTVALIVAQPLGMAAQRRLTTSGDPGNLEIVSVRRIRGARPSLHRVLTRG